MKTKRKIVFFIALISLFYCVSLIQNTYAKYVTSATASTNMTIAKWKVLVNNQDVVNNSNFSTTITPHFEGNDNIAPGVIAPSATGYFDIVIDGSESDLSFNYTINVNPSASSNISDLRLTSYKIDGTTYTDVNNISKNILLNDTTKTKTIRFFVEWNDDSLTENMNNANDTIAAQSGVASLDVSIRLTQLKD